MNQTQTAISKETAAKVFRAKRELQALIDCVGDLLIQVDNAGVVTRCNRSFARLIERPFEQIIGCRLEELLQAMGLRAEKACGRAGREYHYPAAERIFCARRYPLRDEGGERRGAVVTFQDITEQQSFAHELERKNLELAAANDELKHSHSRLLQQEKLAAIGQLAAGVAHEINNPVGFVTSNLNTLTKYLERIGEFIAGQQQLFAKVAGAAEEAEAAALRRRLKLDYLLEDAGALLEESRDGVERVKVIVQNLKNFSRVDQARYGLTDINRCLDETLNIINNELKYKAEVIKDYGELAPTWCHPQQLNQVFMNLLLNAGQAIKEKERGKITIKTRQRRDSIFITITDTGQGITPEHFSRLFEPFFTTKEPGKGTGLSLSIAHDIVTQHGGEIIAASAPGVGTTFRIRLPVREHAPAPDQFPEEQTK